MWPHLGFVWVAEYCRSIDKRLVGKYGLVAPVQPVLNKNQCYSNKSPGWHVEIVLSAYSQVTHIETFEVLSLKTGVRNPGESKRIQIIKRWWWFCKIKTNTWFPGVRTSSTRSGGFSKISAFWFWICFAFLETSFHLITVQLIPGNSVITRYRLGPYMAFK